VELAQAAPASGTREAHLDDLDAVVILEAFERALLPARGPRTIEHDGDPAGCGVRARHPAGG
jgi:hypothetical protein